jgi:hypothetical protein
MSEIAITEKVDETMFLKRPIQNTPEEILDKFSVTELINFERFCRDNAQWDEMKKCLLSIPPSPYRGFREQAQNLLMHQAK